MENVLCRLLTNQMGPTIVTKGIQSRGPATIFETKFCENVKWSEVAKEHIQWPDSGSVLRVPESDSLLGHNT